MEKIEIVSDTKTYQGYRTYCGSFLFQRTFSDVPIKASTFLELGANVYRKFGIKLRAWGKQR